MIKNINLHEVIEMSNTFFNDNILPKVQKVLSEFRKQGKKDFLTSEAIEKQLGRYIKDNCPAENSFNAHYGKFLKDKESILKIKEIQKEVKIKDKYGSTSMCSKWELL